MKGIKEMQHVVWQNSEALLKFYGMFTVGCRDTYW